MDREVIKACLARLSATALPARLAAILSSTPRIANQEKLRTTLSALVLVRVIILSSLLFINTYSVFSSGREASVSDHLYLEIAAIFLISLLNVLAIRIYSNLSAVGYTQFTIDIVLSTLAIHATGSPVPILLYLLVILGASIVFGGHGSVIVAAFAGICYATLASNLVQHTAFSANTMDIFGVYVALIGVALISTYISRQFEQLGSIAHKHAKDLDELTQKQQQLFDDISEGIITLDLDSVITGINQAARAIIRLNNLDAEHFLGQSLPTLLESYGVKGGESLLNRTDTADASEITLHQAGNSEEICVSYSVRPLKDADGIETGKMLIFNDVSHVRNIEERLQLHERMTQLLSETTELPPAPSELHQDVVQTVGESAVMRQVFSLVSRVAASDASVLIYGESGTGKELIAKTIHARSNRKTQPFVAINCGAIPENLIESELFGHKKGSFTGAVSDNPGLFRQAQNGTIFLDEIGDLPLHLQTKLLRVLQERRIRSVGDVRDQPVDVRVVAATNRDLKREIKAGKFREDLYYRLNVVNIVVPPLRDRKEDIPLLVRYFIGKLCDEDRVLPQISPEAIQILMSYSFPGNVRELENAIERALVLGGSAILPAHLPEEMITACPVRKAPPNGHSSGKIACNDREISLPVDLEEELSRIEKAYLIKALEQAGGIKKNAAQLLGLNFRSFRYRLKKYGYGDVADIPDSMGDEAHY